MWSLVNPPLESDRVMGIAHMGVSLGNPPTKTRCPFGFPAKQKQKQPRRTLKTLPNPMGITEIG